MSYLGRRVRSLVAGPGVKEGFLIFVSVRLFLSFWSVVALAINPIPEEPDEVVRPYLGETNLSEGVSGLLLGPWQRFDTLRYMHIARQGYTNEENSVFPPLYPGIVRILGLTFGGGSVGNLTAGMIISNLACLGLLVLLYKVVSAERDPATATRTLVYLVFFPTGFFLFAPYTESLFILLALASLWAGRRGRFWWAGILGCLASLTRLTGWILVIPVACEYWRQRMPEQDAPVETGDQRRPFFQRAVRAIQPDVLAVMLPIVGLLGFLAWRSLAGLPPINMIYARYWYQKTGIPGADLISALGTLFFGGIPRNNELIALSLDFATTLLLIVTTFFAFRRLGTTYGLYSAMLLIFILLPTSEVKPLYSFSRYALAFFPTFMILGEAGKSSVANRLILYPSLLLYLYFSGQFFAWGWVA